MCRRCSCASAAKTDSSSSSRRSASETFFSDVDLLNGGELHGRAALAHRLPDRGDFRQRVRTLGRAGLLPREGLDVEDAALLVLAAEDEVRRIVGHEPELLERGPVALEELAELAVLLRLHPVAAQRDQRIGLRRGHGRYLADL